MGSHATVIERPDRMVFDFDPDEGLGFDAVKKAALDIRRQLADIGLASFAMLSGGKGVHVVVPLDPGHGWDAHKDFAKHFAEALSLAAPDRYVATMNKAKRKGKIFVDWLRNQRGSTAIMPYAARAREGAPVAAPIAWDALGDAGVARTYMRSATRKVSSIRLPSLVSRDGVSPGNRFRSSERQSRVSRFGRVRCRFGAVAIGD